jgi:hypothetical protein
VDIKRAAAAVVATRERDADIVGDVVKHELAASMG